MPMYVHLKHVLPFFAGQQGFYEGKRAEDLLKQEAIRLVNPDPIPNPEPPKEEYEDRQIAEPPKDRMMRGGKRK